MVVHNDVINDVRKVQNGDTSYYDVLLSKCGQIVTTIVKRYLNILRKYNIDVDDFKQHLYLSFFECIKKFPENHGNCIAYFFTYLNQSALQFLQEYNKISDDEKPLSLNTLLNDDDNKEMTLIDTIADENAKLEFEELENKILHEQSAYNIRKVLQRFISDTDINFLFDVYGFNGIKTLCEVATKYGLSINDSIKWERLIILTLRTNREIYECREQLMSNINSAYNYTYSRFKYTNTSSTEHIAIKNIYLEQKIERLKERVKTQLPQLHKNIASATPDETLVRIPPKSCVNFD